MNPAPVSEKWNNRSLFHLVWPFVIEQLLAVTMGAADTVMVSPLGEYAVSGVNIVDNINNFLIIAFIALSMGGAVVVSQYIGRQDYENSRLASRQLVYIVFFISVLITIMALFIRAPILNIFYGRLESDVMDAAMVYFIITALSYPLLGLYNACASLFRSAGNSQVPMRIAIMVNVINIGGNALFVYVFKLGVAGVALSTFLCRVAAAAVLFYMLVKNSRYPVSLFGITDMKIIPSMVRKILNIGIPSGLENSMFQFGRLMTQRIFPFFGTSVIAANAVASVINSFSFMTGNAYCMAALTVVGQCIGAGDYDAAKKSAVKILKIAWATIFVFSGSIFLFRNHVIVFFNLSPEAQDTAKVFLSVHSLFSILAWTLSFVLPYALRAAGDAKFIMAVGIVSCWAVRVVGSYFFSFTLGLGPVGVWLAMGMDFISRGICFTLRWKRGKWQKAKVID